MENPELLFQMSLFVRKVDQIFVKNGLFERRSTTPTDAETSVFSPFSAGGTAFRHPDNPVSGQGESLNALKMCLFKLIGVKNRTKPRSAKSANKGFAFLTQVEDAYLEPLFTLLWPLLSNNHNLPHIHAPVSPAWGPLWVALSSQQLDYEILVYAMWCYHHLFMSYS